MSGIPLVAASFAIVFLFLIGFRPPGTLYILFLVPIALSSRGGVRGGLAGSILAVALAMLTGRINQGVFLTETSSALRHQHMGHFYRVRRWLRNCALPLQVIQASRNRGGAASIE